MSTSKNSNQQTLADLGANERPLMLEKGNYIPWENRFRRFLDNKLEDGEQMWNSIQNGPYQRPMIPNPDNTQQQILEPLSKMTKGNKKQYIADVRVMDYLIQAIPNDIYNSVDARNGNDESNQIVQRVPRTKSTLGKANAIKDEAGINLNNEESDFMFDTSYGKENMEELTAAVMLMDQIQPADGNAETVPSYDAKAVSEVNTSSKVLDQMSHVKRKTIIHTSDDDQIDSNIIFDDPFVENNGGTSKHDSNANDKYNNIQILAYNVQREAENQK
ncbi:hypothetical protein Tco_0906951 [Tanacetum coccineum]|uniref:Uncharacterized protein n=1 Tax=Tanacetum coccineum TaxID=301880 RepID=A0ABQ5CHW7_9ASTR